MTTIAHRDRFDFSPIPERPVFDWPEGRHLAMYVGLNVEWFSFESTTGAALAQSKPVPDVMNHAWRDYGNRVGHLADV